MWDPPSCEGLLYNCCIGVVNLTFSGGTQCVSPTLMCLGVVSLLCIVNVIVVHFAFFFLIFNLTKKKADVDRPTSAES
jgi:hypothetical protein